MINTVGAVNCGWGKRNSCGNCGARHRCDFDCHWNDATDRCELGNADDNYILGRSAVCGTRIRIQVTATALRLCD